MEALVLIAELPWAHFAAESGWSAALEPIVPPRTRRKGATATQIDLPLRVGARTVGRLRRRLVRRPFSLLEALAPHSPEFPDLPDGAHGFFVTSMPLRLLDPTLAAFPGLTGFVRQRYRRSYAKLDGSYEGWLRGLSAKSRSTLQRKIRRFAERSGGAIDLRCYARPEEMPEYHRLARRVSALSYQERLLGCGLPEGAEMLERLQGLAARDAVRGWILFLDGEPVSYLHAPALGDVLVYDHLGYDPAAAALSPGIVLQAGAMRGLFAEKRFRLFDFTEGEGRHKSLFATGDISCADVLLLRSTAANLATGYALLAFDALVDAARKGSIWLGLDSLAARVRR
jgi:hypothetical protein